MIFLWSTLLDMNENSHSGPYYNMVLVIDLVFYLLVTWAYLQLLMMHFRFKSTAVKQTRSSRHFLSLRRWFGVDAIAMTISFYWPLLNLDWSKYIILRVNLV